MDGLLGYSSDEEEKKEVEKKKEKKSKKRSKSSEGGREKKKRKKESTLPAPFEDNPPPSTQTAQPSNPSTSSHVGLFVPPQVASKKANVVTEDREFIFTKHKEKK
eukprot:CAMPEP_0201508822 /NCGR_PEP_ID=MMETSP0161_2-20130828/2058_1 /ASSEMBLY_ACC=CAM_ASM_000251 /TAXON_ID=180227 /ORGANISM="Neoparamoeba aestuarina, Strain SoJaBio B1-5/56/2" /LENGTH=104 /DNA_ID=CAMNT_0047903591 /DNA_START=91 /DNA_END=402 /DNA_ORIENTATION=-